MKVYNNEIEHSGVLGMKWGRRKGPSTSEMRWDRTNINKRELKKAKKKYNVNGQTTEHKILQMENKAMTEAGNISTNKMLKKYGQAGLDKLDRSDKIRTTASFIALMALPVTAIGGSILTNGR